MVFVGQELETNQSVLIIFFFWKVEEKKFEVVLYHESITMSNAQAPNG